jgi:hypothetical protein
MAYTANDVYSLLSQIQNNQNDGGYQTQILNNYQQLLDTVSKENNILDSTYNKKWTFNSLAGQQSKYMYQSSTILSKIYTYGFWIYLILAVILCVVVSIKPNSIFIKVILVLIIILYPFYIYPLEEFCYMISVYIWSLLLSNTYDNGYNNTSIEYGLNGSPGSFGPEEGSKDVVSHTSSQAPPSSAPLPKTQAPTQKPIPKFTFD